MPAITVDPACLEVAREKVKLPIKGSDPGSRARSNHHDEDFARIKELDEKLRRLAEQSRTSVETFVADDAKATSAAATETDAARKASAPETATTKMVSASVQTSLTDITNLGKRPGWNLHFAVFSFQMNHRILGGRCQTLMKR